MLAYDGREAAKAVNSMFSHIEDVAWQNGNATPPHPRATARRTGFLFGHYDSRGGATFMPNRSAYEAFMEYGEIFGWDPGTPDKEKFDAAFTDYIGEATLIFFDDDPEIGELDKDYEGKFKIHPVRKFWWDGRWDAEAGVRSQTDGKWHLCEDRIFACFCGTKPENWREGDHEYRISRRRADLGEDAWGLAYGTGL